MMDQDKDTALIIRFLDLELSDAELTAFEKRLSEDAEFENKFQTYLEAHTLVNTTYPSKKKQILAQQWRAILSEKDTKVVSQKTPWKWIGGIAATLLILVSVWQLNISVKKTDMNQLIADSWNKKIGLDFNAIRTTSKDSLKLQILNAFKTYEKKEYQSTIHQLIHYKPSANYYEEALLLKGLSYYKKGEVNIALQTLDSLIVYPTGKKSKVAKWYKGLIYLEQGDIEAAKQFLKLPDTTNKNITLKE